MRAIGILGRMNQTQWLDLLSTYTRAWSNRDRSSAEGCCAEDLQLVSPWNAYASREEFFEDCWDTSEGLRDAKIAALVSNDGQAMAVIEGLKEDESFGDVTLYEARDGKLTNIRVLSIGNDPLKVLSAE
jgi:hypothetical protein